MAATSTTTKKGDADAPDSFAAVYAECRDVTEKLDLLAFAVNELGDAKLTRAAKEWKDNQLAVNPPSSFNSLREMVNEGPAESITDAKRIAEADGTDLPEEPEGTELAPEADKAKATA